MARLTFPRSAALAWLISACRYPQRQVVGEGELKRLTTERRKWFEIRRRREARRGQYRQTRGSVVQVVRDEGDIEFRRIRALLPPIDVRHDELPKFAAFQPPKIFSLNERYEDTLAFLMDFQKIFFARKFCRTPTGKLRPYYADFGKIEKIDPGAGLVLAAEIDRYAKSHGGLTRVFDHLWQESVHDYFTEAGLFDLLGIDPHVIKFAPSVAPGKKTLKFMSGDSTTGADAAALLSRLESLTSRQLTARPVAYAAVAEALANVLHAYPSWHRSWPYSGSRRWWASAFWDASVNRIGLQLYDHGAGIPATLPKQTHYPWILKFLDPEGTPAGLIAAALEYGRTSTGQPGRGKGLAEMSAWIERTGVGFLRILSGAGQVTYRPGGAVEKRNYDAPFRGTLIEWELALHG